MIDMDKIMTGLEFCTSSDEKHFCDDCPYNGAEYCNQDLMADAFALLKLNTVEEAYADAEGALSPDTCIRLLSWILAADKGVLINGDMFLRDFGISKKLSGTFRLLLAHTVRQLHRLSLYENTEGKNNAD